MEPMARIRIVPVIEEVIVEKRPAHERRPVDRDTMTREGVRHATALNRDRHHMLVHGHITMLDELAAKAETALALEASRLGGNLGGSRRRGFGAHVVRDFMHQTTRQNAIAP